MKLSTKAQIEISFHWIFILIAGGAILAFFLIITKGEKKGADDQLSASIGARLEALLSVVQQNPDATQLHETLNVELQFRCEQDGHTYSLKGSDRRFYLYSQIIFSPETVGESKTITWTKLYSAPYPVAQILYLSDEKTQYIFLDSTKKYYDLMPDIFEKNLTTVSELNNLEDKGFRNYIIITSETDSFQLRNSIKKKAKIVNILSQKKVEFIEPTAADTQRVIRPYVNDETLFGAIITGEPELYGCTMEKLMQASRITGEINKKRIELFQFSQSDKCNYFYGSGVPAELVSNIITYSTYNLANPVGSYDRLNEAITSLSNLNKALASADCPTIY